MGTLQMGFKSPVGIPEIMKVKANHHLRPTREG
jgi:hypothetical protein